MDAQSGSDLGEVRSESRASPKVLRRVGVGALVIALVATSIGIFRRHQRDAQVAEWTQAQEIPAVSIVLPQQGVSGVKLTLPGDLRAWYEAPIYARVNGYLKRWYSDYGAQVKAGQLLAEIDAPDLDAQLAAAQAKLNVANSAVRVRRAELDFAKTTYERWRDSRKGSCPCRRQWRKRAISRVPPRASTLPSLT